MNRKLVTLIWWPHSGGRWLSRTILKSNPAIFQTTFVHPWIFNSTDDMLSLDITAQVHKARSLKELKQNLNVLKQSTDLGRVSGLKEYYTLINNNYSIGPDQKIVLGESCMGSPEPKPVDLKSIFKAFPKMHVVHLVRNPVDAFNSFENRAEMDGDPVKIAGSWLTLNSMIRHFFETEGRQYKNQYKLVRYEDLLDDPRSEIIQLCKFFEIKFDQDMLTAIDERWGKSTDINVDKNIKKIIESIAEKELKAYQYL